MRCTADELHPVRCTASTLHVRCTASTLHGQYVAPGKLHIRCTADTSTQTHCTANALPSVPGRPKAADCSPIASRLQCLWPYRLTAAELEYALQNLDRLLVKAGAPVAVLGEFWMEQPVELPGVYAGNARGKLPREVRE